MDSSQSHEPQRLSALYQYHNAPEVAPAHGLEYDDNVYPHSDKYPVIREAPAYDPSNYQGKHAFPIDNRPPRIIFGLKVRTFLLVSVVMCCVVVGAAVGGAVGGKSMREKETGDGMSYTNAADTTNTIPSASKTLSAYAAATPTYTPLASCQNNTLFTSSYATGVSDTQHAGLNFTAYCDIGNPLTTTKANNITQAFVYSFADCMEICAGYNFLHDSADCSIAVYAPDHARPENCWVGSVEGSVELEKQEGVDIGLLVGQ